MCVLIVRAEVVDRSMGLLGPTRLTHQSNKGVQGTMITGLGSVAQGSLHPSLAKRSVESPTCVNIRESALCEFREPCCTGKQIHVPQMTVVPGRIGRVALGVGAHQRDGRVPISALFRSLDLFEPLHRTSIAQHCPVQRRGSGRRQPTSVRHDQALTATYQTLSKRPLRTAGAVSGQ